VDPKFLKLTKQDDNRIYSSFKAQFPELDVSNMDESALKSKAAKDVRMMMRCVLSYVKNTLFFILSVILFRNGDNFVKHSKTWKTTATGPSSDSTA
jgi:hypothetical protein